MKELCSLQLKPFWIDPSPERQGDWCKGLVCSHSPGDADTSSKVNDALHSEKKQQENGPSVGPQGNGADKDGTFTNKGTWSQGSERKLFFTAIVISVYWLGLFIQAQGCFCMECDLRPYDPWASNHEYHINSQKCLQIHRPQISPERAPSSGRRGREAGWAWGESLSQPSRLQVELH